jgi:hypothetical protein
VFNDLLTYPMTTGRNFDEIVRAILSFPMLSKVKLECLALSAAGVHLVRSQ